VSFRRRRNRHDAWAAYRNQNGTEFARTGLPPQVFETERSLREFLTTGHLNSVEADLNVLSDEQFNCLFHLVSSFFDHDMVDFGATESRRLKR
jgi:hypothetical protein